MSVFVVSVCQSAVVVRGLGLRSHPVLFDGVPTSWVIDGCTVTSGLNTTNS